MTRNVPSTTNSGASSRERVDLLWPTLAALAVAVVLAFAARGLAGDEEAAHYLMARYAPGSPRLFLSLVGRPLVTLALALPAQAGFFAARLASALATAAAAYLVARLARQTRWVHPAWAVAFFLAQPFLLAHAATAMTEPWTAALVALALTATVERRLFLLALAAAVLPLARFESLAFWPFVLWILLRGKRARYLALLPIPLLLWNFAGTLATGDPIWLVHQTQVRAYPQRSFFHYARALAWILGAGLFVPVLAGTAEALRELFRRRTIRRGTAPPIRTTQHAEKTGNLRGDNTSATVQTTARHRTLLASVTILTGALVVYTALAWWRPVTFGNLRYFAYVSPAVALLAAAGVATVRAARTTRGWFVLSATTVAAALVWDHPLLGDFTMLSRRDTFFPAAALAWIILYALPRKARRVAPILVLVLSVAGLARRGEGTLHLTPTPQDEAVARSAALIQPGVVGRIPIHSAHPLLAFYAGGNPYDRTRFPAADNTTRTTAKTGSLLFWDSHYMANRGPQTTAGAFLRDPRWTYLGGTAARDSTWAGGFFLLRTPGALPTDKTTATQNVPVQGGLDRDSWAVAAALAQTGVPSFRVAARQDPGNPSRWRDLAFALDVAGRTVEARKTLARAERMDPGNPKNDLVRANFLRRAGRLQEAYDMIRRALARRPDDGRIQLAAAQILLQAKRPTEAGPHLLRAAHALPHNAEVQYMAGRYLFERGQWKAAERRLRRAVRLNPRVVAARVFEARALAAQGKSGKAEAALRALIRRRPKVAEGYLYLGDLLAAEKRQEEAESVWRKGLVQAGNDSRIVSRLRKGTPSKSLPR